MTRLEPVLSVGPECQRIWGKDATICPLCKAPLQVVSEIREDGEN